MSIDPRKEYRKRSKQYNNHETVDSNKAHKFESSMEASTAALEIDSLEEISYKNSKNSLALLDAYIRKDLDHIKAAEITNMKKSPTVQKIEPNMSTKPPNTQEQNINEKTKMLDNEDVYPNESERLTYIGQYKVEALIGKGSFGKVYKCTRDSKTYAVKLELAVISRNSQLRNEYMMYKKLCGIKGIPRIYTLGSHEGCYYMVMDLLGPNLHRLHEQKTILFSTAFVLKIGLKLIEIFREVHKRGIILRDLKPDNILIHNDEIYIIDLGMAKYYIKKDVHIQKRVGKELAGTVRYASIRTHRGIEQSRRDDLECMLYSLIYLCAGKLPWMGISAKSRREKFDKIRRRKQNTSHEALTERIEGGEVFAESLDYIKSLGFKEKPDYSKMKNMFISQIRKLGEVNSRINLEKEKQKLQMKKDRLLREEEERREQAVHPNKRGWWSRFKACFCC